jgi:hypothetical protein
VCIRELPVVKVEDSGRYFINQEPNAKNVIPKKWVGANWYFRQEVFKQTFSVITFTFKVFCQDTEQYIKTYNAWKSKNVQADTPINLFSTYICMSRNVGTQIPGDAASHPERTDNSFFQRGNLENRTCLYVHVNERCVDVS